VQSYILYIDVLNRIFCTVLQRPAGSCVCVCVCACTKVSTKSEHAVSYASDLMQKRLSAMCRELHVVLDVGDGVGAMTAATAMRSPLYSVCAAG